MESKLNPEKNAAISEIENGLAMKLILQENGQHKSSNISFPIALL